MTMSQGNKKLKSVSVQDKQLYAAFLARFKNACDLMAGEGFYGHIPDAHLRQLFKERVAPLKLDFQKGDFPLDQVRIWEDWFRERMSSLVITTRTGKNMAFGEYFRDGMLLVFYAEGLMGKDSSPILSMLVEAYGFKSKLFQEATLKIMVFIDTLGIFHSDLEERVLLRDFSTTILRGAKLPDNKIRLRMERTASGSVKIDGNSREVFQVGWSDFIGKLAFSFADTEKLVQGSDGLVRLPVYIQKHALMRLSERLSMQKGLMLFMLWQLFDADIHCVQSQNTHLIAFDYDGKRLGYLVSDLVEEKLVIRTFLFLTNDGTPEGKRLASLTKLKKLDKQYLEIDTLKGISKLAIADHPELVELFNEVGCGDLFNLAELANVLELDKLQKSPELLLKYLQGSPFMKRF
jgi:hypothetical protein